MHPCVGCPKELALKEKKNLILIGVLVLALAAAAYVFLRSPTDKPAAGDSQEIAQQMAQEQKTIAPPADATPPPPSGRRRVNPQ